MKVVSAKEVEGVIKSLVGGRGLQLEFEKVLHVALLVPVLMFGSETMIWIENERSSIRAVEMESLRGWLGIRRMDRMQNTQIREICGVKERGGWGG